MTFHARSPRFRFVSRGALLVLAALSARESARSCALALAGEIEHAGSARVAAPDPAPLGPVPRILPASDWAGIRAAHDAGRHVAFAVVDGFAARSPGQGWTARFDGRGFLACDDAGAWTWGLELVRYGFEGAQRDVGSPLCGSAEGQRVAYARDESLEEWWVNDVRGLEHGFTLRDRPAAGGASDVLRLELAVRGGLAPRVDDDGRGVAFAHADGASALTYSGLVVFDADGTELPAWFELGAPGLVLKIDERGARYPLTIDPVVEQAYLKASNTRLSYEFGTSVAVSGDTVVVGSIHEASDATGVDGNQASTSAARSGAAYVFVRTATGWSQQAYLKASNTDAQDLFGWSVSVSDDTLVVGAIGESSAASGVNGNEADDSLLSAGAAYVFARNGTTWTQEAYLKASNPDAHDDFGWSVSVSGDRLVVGTGYEDSAATGVNGNGANDSAADAGAAYVFARSGTSWSQEAYLKASNTDSADRFGGAVGIAGDTVVVGAAGEDSDAAGVNGDQSDDSAGDAGAAYVFVRSGASWSQQAYLKASNAGALDGFGAAVSVSQDTLVVGAPQEDSSAVGVNGNQADESASFAGAAYVFVRSGLIWSQQAYLKASNTGTSDQFGCAVSVSGDSVAVGAFLESSAATGVDGDQANDDAGAAGAAYVFARAGTTWRQRAYVKATNAGAGDWFGWSVAMSGGTFVAGAPHEASNATGVGGNQGNNGAANAGAAYEYALSLAYCFGDGTAAACPCGNASAAGAGAGCSNSLGLGARLESAGIPSVSNDTFVLLGEDMPNSSALYFQGTARLNAGLGAAFGDGLRCIGGSIVRLGTKFNAGGASEFPVAGDPSVSVRSASQGDPLGAGTTRHYQVWYRNAAAFCTTNTFNLSNGLSITWSS